MQKKQWFTLIEILIAIGVFSVGVLAVLNLVITNLSTLDRTQVKTVATLLAKEGIELAFHLRDANLTKSLPWNCVFANDLYTKDPNFDIETQIANNLEQVVCKWYFWSGEHILYQMSIDPQHYYTVQIVPYDEDFSKRFETNRLYLYWDDIHKIHRYSYQQKELSWEATFFARYLDFVPLQEWDNQLSSDKILKVTSHVLYQKWSMTGDVILESFIWNH